MKSLMHIALTIVLMGCVSQAEVPKSEIKAFNLQEAYDKAPRLEAVYYRVTITLDSGEEFIYNDCTFDEARRLFEIDYPRDKGRIALISAMSEDTSRWILKDD